MAQDQNTREGFKYWDKFCAIPRFSFWRGGDDEKGSVITVPDKTGGWIEQYEAAKIVDEMQDVINELESEKKALKQRLEMRAV
jgi:hypothetical protein